MDKVTITISDGTHTATIKINGPDATDSTIVSIGEPVPDQLKWLAMSLTEPARMVMFPERWEELEKMRAITMQMIRNWIANNDQPIPLESEEIITRWVDHS